MAFPQGITFCADPTLNPQISPNDAEAGSVANRNTFDMPTYPRTTAQGNTVGWEGTTPSNVARDRSTTNDPRICGLQSGVTVDGNYRFDLPSAGNYNVGLAAGDGSYVAVIGISLLDTNTLLGTLAVGSTLAANSFKDAANNTWTAANWPSSNVKVPFTFSTTIARFRVVANTDITFAYMESLGGTVVQSMLLLMGV